MSITATPFGIDQIGRPMTLYTMTNKIGASVSVLDFGAHLVSIRVPDRAGKLGEVCLGFDTLEEYDRNPSFLGATIGRVGNRIGGAQFTLNGQTYTLFKNDGPNTLHGGREGFDKKWWRGQTLEAETEDAVVFTYVAHDGEEGFPGKMHCQVTYAWDSQCRLTIRYLAQCDQDTLVNLTNHAYYNLSGRDTMLGHTLQVFSGKVTDVDGGLIPTGEFLPVDGTLLDLRSPQPIGDAVARRKECRLMDAVDGFDVNFVLDGEGMKAAAVLRDPDSGREMRVFTTEPGMQVYSGQGLDLKGHGGAHYGPYAGVALETQHFPDSPHHPNFPTITLKAGDTYQSATVYAFSAT